ncbi:MAG: DUF6624 domain-containing protein [archaeon]
MNHNQKLFYELEQRFKLDQELIKQCDIKKYTENCHKNSEWLKRIISKQGGSSEEKISKQGEFYSWLIVQHSEDIDFQKLCLKLLKNLSKTKERNQHIAYLIDRILVKENKKQIYGTQFSNGNPFPILDEGNLDKRRNEMGLGSFEEYSKTMQKLSKHYEYES